MPRKTISRSALLSWNPNSEKNSLVACGTASFMKNEPHSINSKLELFDLSNDQPNEILSISVPSTFNRILWTSVEANRKNLIVGAFQDGRIEVYNVEMLLNAESDAVVEVPRLHSGTIKGLCVSSFQPNLIASGGINAEIALWDLDNIRKASLINVKKSESFLNTSDLAWNPRVAHILAAASDSGIVSIIDLRSKKEVTALNLPDFVPVSSIAWNPDTPTSIVTGSNDDANPFAYLWDLRAAKAPKNVFKGHSEGISSISWCREDSKMMLSTGNDGKSLCWDPESNQIIREYSADEEGLDIKFCPSNPNIFCVSHRTFIEVRSIADEVSNNQNISERTLDEAPKWLNCPTGISFGGNNICSVFRSSSRNVWLVKPKIDYFSTFFEDLIQFENMIKDNLIQNACDNFIEEHRNQDEKIIFELLKHFASPKVDIELLKLAQKLNDFMNSNKSNSEPIEDSVKNLNISNDSEYCNLNDLSEKIIESDFEAAVNECLNTFRYTDALIISNCGGFELRSKVEDFILKNNCSFHLNLAINLGRKDLYGFISTASLSEWFRIMKVIFKNSTPESLSHFSKVLSQRLIKEKMFYPALFAASLGRDSESFLEIVFSLKFKDENPSISELIYLFKIIRIIEAIKPKSLKSFENYSTKLKVFEIVSKLISLLSSAGLRIDFLLEFLDKDFYESQIKNTNSDIDAFFENVHPRESNLTNGLAYPTANLSNSANINSYSHQIPTESIPTYLPPRTVPIHKNITPSVLSPTNVNYNDAPIINPKLAKFSPQICNQEIKLEDVSMALKSLSVSIESKTLPDAHARIVKECFQKLNPELICSKMYSDLSRACISSLFKELSSCNFDSSSTLAANILASFFAETKDWILPLKRLIEIAKNQ